MTSFIQNKTHYSLPLDVPTAPIVFYKNYSRQLSNGRQETYNDVINRVINAIKCIGDLTVEELSIIHEVVGCCHAFPSGRALWIAGTKWSKDPENVSGYYNCTSTVIDDLGTFGLVMGLSMMGCGTGTVLDPVSIQSLPLIRQKINLLHIVPVSSGNKGQETTCLIVDSSGRTYLRVGDSRQGWVDALMKVLFIAVAIDQEQMPISDLSLIIDLSQVRAAGSPLHGFGGVANPVQLEVFFRHVIALLNSAYGRQLTTAEVCLLLDEVAAVVVAGNIRRSAGLRQFDYTDSSSHDLKRNLYRKEGNTWRIDEKRIAMRLSAHTYVAHHRPTLKEVEDSIVCQFETGEGAIEYAPEAVARGNSDLFKEPFNLSVSSFIRVYEDGIGTVLSLLDNIGISNKEEQLHRIQRFGLNPCGEIIGHNFYCNLSEVHLNMIDPHDFKAQKKAFYVAGMMAATLLHQTFPEKRYQQSREIDPIVGVSFTGLFDFFVCAFGLSWLHWMMNGRPQNTYFPDLERKYLLAWRKAAWSGVQNYCISRGLRVPNRVTAVQPAGTKSLFTNASPGWHPPKAVRYIRRVLFSANDPVAMACRDVGYNVVSDTSLSDSSAVNKDCGNENCFVEIPIQVKWANWVGDDLDLSKLPAKAQWGLYMTVQNNYTDHNTSATIELDRDEILEVARLVYEAMGKGYVSCTFIARQSECFPSSQLPIQTISKERYLEELDKIESRGKSSLQDFEDLVLTYRQSNDTVSEILSTCSCNCNGCD